MGTLTRHLSKRLGAAVTLVLAGFVSIVQTLDLMKNGADVIARHGSSWTALGFYIFLRLPELISAVFLPAVLLGTLLEFSRLALSNEALAMRASGLSVWRLLVAFLPAVLILGALGFAIEAYTAPWAARSLARWNSEDGLQRAVADNGEWVRDGASLVRIGQVSDDHRMLGDVSIFYLNSDGLLAEEIVAHGARFDGRQWTLLGVRILHPATGADRQLATLKWASRLRPGRLTSLSLSPQLMSFASLAEEVTGHLPTTVLTRLYVLEMLRRIRFPLLVPLMMLLAAPVLMEFERVGGIVRALAFGAVIGFGYFVIDGVALSVGAAGWLAAPSAVLAAPLIFVAFGAAIMLRAMG